MRARETLLKGRMLQISFPFLAFYYSSLQRMKLRIRLINGLLSQNQHSIVFAHPFTPFETMKWRHSKVAFLKESKIELLGKQLFQRIFLPNKKPAFCFTIIQTRSPNGQLAALPSTMLPIIIAPNYYSYPPQHLGLCSKQWRHSKCITKQ